MVQVALTHRQVGLSVQQLLHHQLGVAKAAGQLLTAAKLLQQRQFVGAEVSFLVDVSHRSHERAEDQLGVVLTEAGQSKRFSFNQNLNPVDLV